MDLLRDIRSEGLLLRRINIRQVEGEGFQEVPSEASLASRRIAGTKSTSRSWRGIVSAGAGDSRRPLGIPRRSNTPTGSRNRTPSQPRRFTAKPASPLDGKSAPTRFSWAWSTMYSARDPVQRDDHRPRSSLHHRRGGRARPDERFRKQLESIPGIREKISVVPGLRTGQITFEGQSRGSLNRGWTRPVFTDGDRPERLGVRSTIRPLANEGA